MNIDEIESFKMGFKNILLNLTVDGNWPGFNGDNPVFPLEMIIDYINNLSKN